jgi:hypothetical protein
VSRWQRYWFGDGGRTSVAILRIAIAASTLLSLALLDNPVSTHAMPFYRPVGIWMIAGHNAPPPMLVKALFVVAWASTGMMLVGLFSRTSHAISCVTAIALAALSFSTSRSWSHQYNVVFLASIAFIGARGGDVLSLDALIRRKRGLPPLNLPNAYQWSIRLVQLAVALMFAGACFHKFLHAHFTLRWALSDNLRHQLLVRYDLANLPRPPLVDWLIDDPWRYKTAAVLNLISQALPMAAVFLMKRPILRAIAGSFFVTETIALGLVVDLWNPHWLPLAAAFIDWDRLFRSKVPPPATSPPSPRRAIRIWIVVFIVYDVLTAFVPKLDQRLNTFPFSGFPMFATVRARPPYYDHQPYGVAADHFEVTSDRALDISIQRWFDHSNRGTWKTRDNKEFEKRLRAILATAQKRWHWWPLRGVRHWLTIYEAPAYPAPAHFEQHPIAVMGEVLPDGTYRSALGKLRGKLGPSREATLELAPTNVDLNGAELIYFKDDRPTPISLGRTIDGPSIALGYQDFAGNPLYFAARTKDGTVWLLAVYSTWRWE